MNNSKCDECLRHLLNPDAPCYLQVENLVNTYYVTCAWTVLSGRLMPASAQLSPDVIREGVQVG